MHSTADWNTHNVTLSEKLVFKTDGERIVRGNMNG
jgi:hypothetical protein